jgi:flagellar hook-basal body complex protein FliE
MVVHPIQFAVLPMGTGGMRGVDHISIPDNVLPIQQSFKQVLQNALLRVNHLQLKAEDAGRKFASGESENLHELMISLEEAKISLQFTIEVRNRAIEAYQELVRMQV